MLKGTIGCIGLITLLAVCPFVAAFGVVFYALVQFLFS